MYRGTTVCGFARCEMQIAEKKVKRSSSANERLTIIIIISYLYKHTDWQLCTCLRVPLPLAISPVDGGFQVSDELPNSFVISNTGG